MMQVSDLKIEINKYLEEGDYPRLFKILYDNKDTVRYSNELSYLYYICDINRESFDQTGDLGIIKDKKTVAEIVEVFCDLKKLVQRAAFCSEYDPSGIVYFMNEHGVTAKELMWLIKSSTPDPDYTLKRIKGEIPVTPIDIVDEESSSDHKDVGLDFIICSNSPRELEETLFYLSRLITPLGISVGVLSINDARSLCAGYNEGMKASSAKYKVYLHHDVRIINRSFIKNLLRAFEDKEVGMVGLIGTEILPEDGTMWNVDRYGSLYETHIHETTLLRNYHKKEPVEAVLCDGFLLATQYDIPWRSDIFDGWDFYDSSQCMEFRRKGYKVVIPYQETSWCLHDCGFVSLKNYDIYKDKFIKEYIKSDNNLEADLSSKEDIDLIVFTGGLITLDTFVHAMIKDTNAVVVDVKNPQESLAPIIERINEKTTVISFNNIGTGYELWKTRNVSLYNILVDHPANYLESISSDYYPGYHAFCIDRGHVEFLRDIFYQIPSAFSFLPHGGIRSGHINPDKDIDILYAGGFRAEEDINFVPLPFGDSEAFFDHAIAYYDQGTYVEAQDAVNDYCDKDGQTYSREQRAIMANYIVRSVEHYFIAERRKGLVSYLADNGFNVCVCGNPVWQEVATAHPGIRYEGMKTPKECLEYISRAKVLINDLPYFSDGAHERVFNGMQNGAVVLSNPSRYLEERFTDGENILFWDGRDFELAARKIKEVLEDDALRAKIVDKAAKLTDNDTWADRLCTILKQNNNKL